MVISTKVFGNRMSAAFGKGCASDIASFQVRNRFPKSYAPHAVSCGCRMTACIMGGQLAVVQFGTRSMSSTAVESGNMLDIKTMCPLTEGTLDAPRLLPAGLLCRTMAEASARREAFLAGAEVCETKREVRLQFLPTRPP